MSHLMGNCLAHAISSHTASFLNMFYAIYSLFEHKTKTMCFIVLQRQCLSFS